jgi:hypothetical protein
MQTTFFSKIPIHVMYCEKNKKTLIGGFGKLQIIIKNKKFY